MKILLVIDTLSSGGAQRQLINIANGLSKKTETNIFLYNPNSEFYSGGLDPQLKIYRSERKKKNGFSFSVLSELFKVVKSYDVVISFLPTANIYCSTTTLLHSRIKHIACEMSITNETEGFVKRTLTNISNYLSTHVICNSFTQANYIKSFPGMNGKVSTVWNGCEKIVFQKKETPKESGHSMIIVGRIAYPKNGLRLLKALDIFYKKNKYLPNIAWAGRDDESLRSRKMKSEMLDFLEDHPRVKEKFTWLGEISDIQAVYSKSDTLLSVSIYEGLPNAICEAMLNGCIVIASRVSDNEIILGHGERGFLCNPLSPDDICSSIENRINISEIEKSKMLSEARSFAEKSFSIKHMIDEYHRIAQKITHQ